MGFLNSITKPFKTIATGVVDGAKAVGGGVVDLGKAVSDTAESAVLITRSGVAKIGGDDDQASRLSRKAGSKITSGGLGLVTGLGGVAMGAVDGTLGAVVNGGVDAVGESARIFSDDAANLIESPAVKAGVNIATGIAITIATGGAGSEVLAGDVAELGDVAANGEKMAKEASDVIALTKKTEQAEELAKNARDAEKLANEALAAAKTEGEAEEVAELEKTVQKATNAAEEAEESQAAANAEKEAAESKIKNSETWNKFKKIALKTYKLGITLNMFEQAKLLLCLSTPTLPPLFTSSKFNNNANTDFRDILSQLGGFIFYRDGDGDGFVVPSIKDDSISIIGSAGSGKKTIELDDTESLLTNMIVHGDGFQKNTRITQIDEFSIKVDKPTVKSIKRDDDDDDDTYKIRFFPVVDLFATAPDKSSTLSVDQTKLKKLKVGMKISGDGIPVGARIMEIVNSTTKNIKIGKGSAGPLNLAPARTKKALSAVVQFRQISKQNLPEKRDNDRIMATLAWFDGKQLQHETTKKKKQGVVQHMVDQATISSVMPTTVFILGDIKKAITGNSATFNIYTLDLESDVKKKWTPPSDFQFGFYVLKSERECLSSAKYKDLLKKAHKIHDGKIHKVFGSTARKNLKLVGMIILGIIICAFLYNKHKDRKSGFPWTAVGVSVFCAFGIYISHTGGVKTITNRFSRHEALRTKMKVRQVERLIPPSFVCQKNETYPGGTVVSCPDQKVIRIKDDTASFVAFNEKVAQNICCVNPEFTGLCKNHVCTNNMILKKGQDQTECAPLGVVSLTLQPCNVVCCEPPMCSDSFTCIPPRSAISGARGTTDSACCKNAEKPPGQQVQISSFSRNPKDFQGAYMLAKNEDEFKKIQVGDIIRSSNGRLFGPTGKVRAKFSSQQISDPSIGCGNCIVLNVVFLEEGYPRTLSQWPENMLANSGPYTVFVVK